jgi:hypothetical protein
MRPAQSRANSRYRHPTVQRPTFWCGTLLVIFGVASVIGQGLQPAPDASIVVMLLLAAGVVEVLAGILDHRTGGVTASLDVVLGLLSIGAAFTLLAPGWDTASSLFVLLALWLIVRGLFDLIGSALMRDEIVQDARLMRSGVDLGLGAVSLIALAIVPWWEIMFGWPESSVAVIRVFAGISVIATGAFLIAESQAFGTRGGSIK